MKLGWNFWVSLDEWNNWIKIDLKIAFLEESLWLLLLWLIVLWLLLMLIIVGLRFNRWICSNVFEWTGNCLRNWWRCGQMAEIENSNRRIVLNISNHILVLEMVRWGLKLTCRWHGSQTHRLCTKIELVHHLEHTNWLILEQNAHQRQIPVAKFHWSYQMHSCTHRHLGLVPEELQ